MRKVILLTVHWERGEFLSRGATAVVLKGFGNVQKTIKYKVEEDFFEDWHVWQYFSIRLSKT